MLCEFGDQYSYMEFGNVASRVGVQTDILLYVLKISKSKGFFIFGRRRMLIASSIKRVDGWVSVVERQDCLNFSHFYTLLAF